MIHVKVNRDKLIDILPDLLADVDEMKDLIPDWHKLEADKLDESITDKINSLIAVQGRT